MGFFDTKLTNVSTLSPDQQQLMGALGPRLSAMASQGVKGSTYQGPLNAPITDAEQANVNNAARFGATAGNTFSDFANYNDANFNNQFQSEIADPTYANFKQNVQPILEESLPTFSTARGNVVARSLNDTSNSLLEQRFAAREAAKNRALNAATAGGNFYSQQQKTLAAPREIAQAGLDREFTNFYAGNQQYQQGINSMLQYLGIQTKGFINEGSAYDKVLAGINTAANVISAFNGGGGGPDSASPSSTYTGIPSGSSGAEYSVGNNSRAGATAGFNSAFGI